MNRLPETLWDMLRVKREKPLPWTVYLNQGEVDTRVHQVHHSIKLLRFLASSTLKRDALATQVSAVAANIFDTLQPSDVYNGKLIPEYHALDLRPAELNAYAMHPDIQTLRPHHLILPLDRLLGTLTWLSPHLKLTDALVAQPVANISAPPLHRWKILR